MKKIYIITFFVLVMFFVFNNSASAIVYNESQISYVTLTGGGGSNPTQFLRPQIEGTLTSIKVYETGGDSSGALCIVQYNAKQTIPKVIYTGIEWGLCTAAWGTGQGLMTYQGSDFTELWYSGTATGSIAFKKDKFYGLIFYQGDTVLGSVFGGSYPQGRYYHRGEDNWDNAGNIGNVVAAYFEMVINGTIYNQYQNGIPTSTLMLPISDCAAGATFASSTLDMVRCSMGNFINGIFNNITGLIDKIISVIYGILRNIFPINIFSHIDNDFSVAVPTSAPDIVLSGAGLFGNRSYSFLASSTMDNAAASIGFDYKKIADYFMYIVTFGIMLLSTVLIVKHLKNDKTE